MIQSTWSLLLYSQKLSGDDLSPSLYQEMIGRNKSHRILTDNRRVKSINITAGRIGKRWAQPVPSVLLSYPVLDVNRCWVGVAPVIKQRVNLLVTVLEFSMALIIASCFALWRNHIARFRIREHYNGCQWFWLCCCNAIEWVLDPFITDLCPIPL